MRTNYSTNTNWETSAAYSRAVKVGNQIYVSGTTAVNETGEIISPKNVLAQSIFIFEKIENVLKALGSSLNDVVRTKAFITNINQFEAFSKAHHQFFEHILPASTLVEVSALVHPNLMIEIEVDAVLNV